MRISCAEICFADGPVKILFFAPHAAIWVHAFPEALIAETLAQSGHSIVYVSCGEALQQVCNPMNASGLDHLSRIEARREICRLCGQQKELLRREFGFTGYDLTDLLEPADQIRATEMLKDLSFEQCTSLRLENVPVGKLALYETILNHKKTGIEFDAGEQREYRAWLQGAVTTVTAGRRLFEREQPDCLVVYNSFYSVNNVMCCLASLEITGPQLWAHRTRTGQLNWNFSHTEASQKEKGGRSGNGQRLVLVQRLGDQRQQGRGR